MEESPENGKESLHSAHANGMKMYLPVGMPFTTPYLTLSITVAVKVVSVYPVILITCTKSGVYIHSIFA